MSSFPWLVEFTYHADSVTQDRDFLMTCRRKVVQFVYQWVVTIRHPVFDDPTSQNFIEVGLEVFAQRFTIPLFIQAFSVNYNYFILYDMNYFLRLLFFRAFHHWGRGVTNPSLTSFLRLYVALTKDSTVFFFTFDDRPLMRNIEKIWP